MPAVVTPRPPNRLHRRMRLPQPRGWLVRDGPVVGRRHRGVGVSRPFQRRRPESNRCRRLCRPLRSHSATTPRRPPSLAGTGWRGLSGVERIALCIASIPVMKLFGVRLAAFSIGVSGRTRVGSTLMPRLWTVRWRILALWHAISLSVEGPYGTGGQGQVEGREASPYGLDSSPRHGI
jgi:hypothetical protein